MTKVNLIGTGRVGETMLRLISSLQGYEIQHVTSRDVAKAEAVAKRVGKGKAVPLADLAAADIWLLTVPDSQISEVATKLASRVQPSDTAVHFSGFHTADVMPLTCCRASAHPNLSFAEPALATKNFPGTPVGIEGDAKACAMAEDLLVALGAKTFPISSDRKVLYHAAAVFSNNFNTVLQAIAQEAWSDAGVSDEMVAVLSKQFLQATGDNIARLGPARALTGPAARGDTDVVEIQGRAVADWHGASGRLYSELSDLARRLATTGRVR